MGNYTAAAISSFAFDISLPVVDGNVVRVLSRIFGVEMFLNHLKKKFYNLATKLLDSKRHSEYNQAIMDFGALFVLQSFLNVKVVPCINMYSLQYQQHK